MKTLPKSMVVVGGGVIGSEYACLFAALGVKTYLVHPKARALDSLLDAEIGEIFMKRMAEMGIQLCMNDSVESCAVEGRPGQDEAQERQGARRPRRCSTRSAAAATPRGWG